MRSKKGIFKIFQKPDILSDFREELHNILMNIEYKILAIVIDKPEYRLTYPSKNLAYEESLKFMCERCAVLLKNENKVTQLHIVLEKRHAKYDVIIKKYYTNFIKEGTLYVSPRELSICHKELNFRTKSNNINGLQVADICAYPIARKHLSPESHHPIYEIIKKKFHKNKNGKVDGFGLKIFPKKR